MSAAPNLHELPGDAPPIHLLPGEKVLRTSQFTPRLILVHLKTTMVLTDQRLVVSRPMTIFWVFPHGYSVISAPLWEITDVSCGDRRETGGVTSYVAYSLVLIAILGALSMFLGPSMGF